MYILKYIHTYNIHTGSWCKEEIAFYIHTYMHTYIHTYIHTKEIAFMDLLTAESSLCPSRSLYVCVCIHMYIQQIQTYIHTRNTYTHTYIQEIHKYIQEKHTCMHTYIQVHGVKEEIAFMDLLTAESTKSELQARLDLAEARRLQTLEAAAKSSEVQTYVYERTVYIHTYLAVCKRWKQLQSHQRFEHMYMNVQYTYIHISLFANVGSSCKVIRGSNICI